MVELLMYSLILLALGAMIGFWISLHWLRTY